MPTPSETRTGFLLALLAALAFGVLPIFGKRAFAEGLDVASLLAWRFSIASALVYPALVSLLGLAFLKRRLRPAAWLALGLSLLGVALTVGFARGPLDTRGVTLALLGAAVVACYLVLGEGLLTGGLAVPATTRAWLLVLLMATLSTAFSIVAMLGGGALILCAVALVRSSSTRGPQILADA